MAMQQHNKKRVSLTTLRRDLNLHHLFRHNLTDFSSPTRTATAATAMGHLKPGLLGGLNCQPRRESFLYRPAIDERESNIPGRSTSRTSSIISNAAHE
ncbi:unnamed protein product [Thelazia callipaeda]|uniref:Uncharacterized protein n=1 Tax=Thelazia callipaeda TaxID=103827 RepID=A0A0N5DAG2_THECL|nr:unnamed protein product [Thelazia callipaeda]